MKVTPLIGPTVNWADLIDSWTRIMGDSPIRVLDKNNIKPGDTYSFIVAMGGMTNDPRSNLVESSYILYHLQFSFLLEMSAQEAKILDNLPGLTISRFEGKEASQGHLLIILSGTLAAWKQALPMILSTKVLDFRSSTQRHLFNQIYNWFNKLNLVGLFAEWIRVELTDTTFRLERAK